jgi:undecaprenyl-diphosphatase
MFSYIVTIILGVVQGFAGIFPVSDFAHQLYSAELSNWKVITAQAQADSSHFLILVSMSHITIGLMVGLYYRRLWAHLCNGMCNAIRFSKARSSHNYSARLGQLILLSGCIAGIMTLLFENMLRTLFGEVFFAIGFIIINGIILLRGDRRTPQLAVSRTRNRKALAAVQHDTNARTLMYIADHTSWSQAIRMGLIQVFALIPGISRTGLLMLSGLRSGLDHQNAATFALLTVSPSLIISGLIRLPEFLAASTAPVRSYILAGAAGAGIAALIATVLFNRFVRTRSLQPFGFYCVGLGMLMLVLAIIRGSVQR